ncbi:MAG: hypothetical protein NT062_15485 [Proteobacteria bacterium]|nr:hypothetical protein [Pseudomonadota bacterium]
MSGARSRDETGEPDLKINSRLIERYLSIVTESRVSMMESPACDLAAYDGPIDAMGEAARADGNEELLRVAIDALLARPVGRLSQFTGETYRWPNEEFVPLLTHAHERLWPDEPLSLPGDAPEVEFVAMTSAEWAASTGRV